MTEFIKKLVSRIMDVEDELSVGNSPEEIFGVLRDCREQLDILNAVRLELIRKNGEQLKSIEAYVNEANSLRDKLSECEHGYSATLNLERLMKTDLQRKYESLSEHCVFLSEELDEYSQQYISIDVVRSYLGKQLEGLTNTEISDFVHKQLDDLEKFEHGLKGDGDEQEANE